VIDNFAHVPSIDGEVIVQIKHNGPPAFFRLDKPASEVTLVDLRPFYGGPPGIFLFKTQEGDVYCWTVFANDNSPVPLFTEDLIVVKVKPTKRISAINNFLHFSSTNASASNSKDFHIPPTSQQLLCHKMRK